MFVAWANELNMCDGRFCATLWIASSVEETNCDKKMIVRRLIFETYCEHSVLALRMMIELMIHLVACCLAFELEVDP